MAAAREEKASPWAVKGLFTGAATKCNAAILDTILLEGDPTWLFTSKNGAISKKRGVSGAAVRERFLRLSSAFEEAINPQRRTALLRFADGSLKIVDEDAFVAMMASWPPRETGVQALQAYVPSAGAAGTVYRNSYRVVSDKGRTATQTHSFTTIGAADAHSGNVQVGHDAMVLSRSKAMRLNQTLDAATRSVVRFLESAHHVRILHAQLDYVVDAESQLWLSWIGDVTTVAGEAALDLTLIPGLSSEKGEGRDSWLPRDARKTMEAEGEAAKTKRAGSPTGRRAGAGSATANRGAKKLLPEAIASKQVAAAAEVAEAMGEDERLELLRHGVRETADDEERLAMGGAPATGDDPLKSRGKPKARQQASAGPSNGGRDPHDGNYPNPFRSVGDFRKAQLRDPKVLDLDEMGHLKQPGTRRDAQAMEAAEMEAALAGYDIDGVGAPAGMLGRKQPGGLDPDAVARMSYQSIARAREEGKKILDESNHADSSNAEAWREYPVTPNEKRREANRKEKEEMLGLNRRGRSREGSLDGGFTRSKDGVKAETKASEQRRKWAEQRGQVPGGPANYYAEVSVTQKDMQVYALLDRARRLREKQEKLADEDQTRADKSQFLESGSEGSGGGGRRPKRSRGKMGQGLGRTMNPELGTFDGHPEGITVSQSMPTLPSATGGGPPMEPHNAGGNSYSQQFNDGATNLGSPDRDGPKWRDRLDKASSEEKDETVADSVNKFEKLDDYLRGKLDPMAAKREKKRAALARSQAAQERINNPNRGGRGRGDSQDMSVVSAGTGQTGQTSGDGSAKMPSITGSTTPGDDAHDELYFASVLILDTEDSAEAMRARDLLEQAGYFVDVEWDGRKCIEMLLYQGKQYDCLLVERDCALADAYEVTEAVRSSERERRMQRSKEIKTEMMTKKVGSSVNVDPFVALPIIAFTADVEPDDLRSYMEVGMDGCVSKPMDEKALLATVKAAAPQHARPVPDRVKNAITAQAGKKKGPKVFKMGAMGTLEGDGSEKMGSSAMAAQSLSLPSSFTAADGSVSGVVQLDADTSMPYTVIDFSMSPNGVRPSTAERHKKPFFNLVVCHDIFDTLERMKIVLSPLAARYPGLQVLVWNYPGQAFTEWREEQLLNNDYMASCLHELLNSVGPEGTKQFDSDKPFHLLGFGNGGNIATFYTAHYSNPALRSLIHCNAFAFVDPHLAGALHDCMNVFSCAPPARPDLPVYFYSRFLFSPAYLASVSTPLALNLYTAVHNPITLEGRIQLCLGALSNIDLRAQLAEIDLPIVCVQATQGALVKPVHTEVFVEHRRGGAEYSEAKTIFEALKNPHKTCVVWVKSGHELFQEARDQMSTLIEQMVTGYHETHDVAYLPAISVDAHASNPMVRQGKATAAVGSATSGSGGGAASSQQGHGHFEDSFIDNVLGQVHDATSGGGGGGGPMRGSAEFTAMQEKQRWGDFSSKMQHEAGPRGQGGGESADAVLARQRKKRAAKLGKIEGRGSGRIMDSTAPAFERNDSKTYKAGQGSSIYPAPEEYPEVKEYMVWRLKRNRKRLQRLDQAARIVQGAFRSYLAWTIVRRLREARAAAFIQRLYRGWKGRLGFLDHMRLIWASQVVQRAWRGFAGRKFFLLLRRMHAAAAHIQRIARGFIGRQVANAKREAQRLGALKLQGLWRKRQARRAAFAMRRKIHAARTLARVYRGHLGRRRATHEREKYLFSKSQSQGIEFGRQMLLEHKLHATRLQSEVQLLTQEKVGAEEQVEALLEEISEFEEAVTQLEKEMHDLSRIETEAVGVLDEDGRFELREQKTRLDREFGEMLSKIADRRERLNGLEGKLATLDRARQGKEEELRTLERKLVVLLDEQQRELESIKRRQEKKGELLLKTQDAITGQATFEGGEGGAGGFSGPSAKDKQQAAQLMQSTETLMKFGFMSMSMTYFSSLNMIRAMRNVSATDTVMAALHENAANATAHAQGGGGGMGGGAPYEDKKGGGVYKPNLRPGQMPGDEALKVSAWSVEDVARWLQTLSLGQYREAFVDASVDGAFLYDLNEDDLKNTLGIEHRLHRKKIINMITKLKLAEAEHNRQMQLHMAEERAASLGLPLPSSGLGDEYLAAAQAPSAAAGGAAAGGGAGGAAGAEGELREDLPPLKFEELAAWVRHSKLKKLKEALDQIPSKRFDKALVKAAYVEDFGTAYMDAYEQEIFNLNKVDEFGNTLLVISSQNGSQKIAKLLIEKGANPDHQNREGQTAGHFANSYGFYDYLAWVFEPSPDGAGGDDNVQNKYGLGPYDGLRVPEIEGGE